MGRKIVKVKKGQTIFINNIKYYIFEAYDFIVRCMFHDDFGRLKTRCFSLGELVMAGYEPILRGETETEMWERRQKVGQYMRRYDIYGKENYE